MGKPWQKNNAQGQLQLLVQAQQTADQGSGQNHLHSYPMKLSESKKRYIRMYQDRLTTTQMAQRLNIYFGTVKNWKDRFRSRKIMVLDSEKAIRNEVEREIYAIIHHCNSASMMESAKERVRHLNAILGGKYI